MVSAESKLCGEFSTQDAAAHLTNALVGTEPCVPAGASTRIETTLSCIIDDAEWLAEAACSADKTLDAYSREPNRTSRFSLSLTTLPWTPAPVRHTTCSTPQR